MKVLRPGNLVVLAAADGQNRSNVFIEGWHFDSMGRTTITPLDILRAALLHTAQQHGIDLGPPAQPEHASERLTLDSERAALDAIAVARWRPQ